MTPASKTERLAHQPIPVYSTKLVRGVQLCQVARTLACCSIGELDLGARTSHQSRRERPGRTVPQVQRCHGHKRAAS
jgi:hypothetical protein